MEERKLNRIKVVLVEKDKTGKWLAEELKVGTTTVSRWCQNITQPDIYTLDAIAKPLKEDVSELLNHTLL
jgi:putative transcriptional regulator